MNKCRAQVQTIAGIFNFVNEESPYVTGYEANGVKSIFVQTSEASTAPKTIQSISENLFTLYPNPTEGNFTLRFEDEGIKTIYIYDLLGNRLYSNQSNEIQVEIKTLDLSAGQYLVKVISDNNLQQVKRLVVRK
jgi:Secretion system C-terminal sorting domain